jgi:hypothetical protein
MALVPALQGVSLAQGLFLLRLCLPAQPSPCRFLWLRK